MPTWNGTRADLLDGRHRRASALDPAPLRYVFAETDTPQVVVAKNQQYQTAVIVVVTYNPSYGEANVCPQGTELAPTLAALLWSSGAGGEAERVPSVARSTAEC